MFAVFHDMIEESVEVFMDDFVVFGNSFDNCLKNLDKMLQRCKDTNLVLNWEKCHFMVKEGIVLGHQVSGAGLEVDKAKIDVISKLPPPTNVKGIRSFLGHASFYRRFIKDFSKITRPQTKLLEKDTPFEFNDECHKSFNSLKEKLTCTPVKMDDPNVTMEEYIRLEEEKDRRRDVHNLRSVETEFPSIVLNDALTPEVTLYCEPTVSPLKDNKIDFRISFDKSDDEDYTMIYDKNSFFYKIISVDDLKTDSEKDNDKVNMPSFPSSKSTISYFNDLDFFKDFENEFPAIVYNDALTSKLDFLTEPTVSPQHIDGFNLRDETSLSKCNEEEQNILYFNDLFPFNVIYPDDSKSDKDNDDDKIDIKHSSRGGGGGPHWKEIDNVEFDIEIKDKKGTENVAADYLSQIDNDETSDDSDVDDNFLGETLMEITTNDTPWFANFANYLVGDIIPKGYRAIKRTNLFWPQKLLLGRPLPFQSMFRR
ncbi:hypothetical protein Tco_0520647 [Tanacetum coccineum]